MSESNLVVEKLNFKDEVKLQNTRIEAKVKCKICGHTQLLGKQDRTICTWCKNYIYKDDITEFKYNLGKAMIEEKRKK